MVGFKNKQNKIYLSSFFQTMRQEAGLLSVIKNSFGDQIVLFTPLQWSPFDWNDFISTFTLQFGLVLGLVLYGCIFSSQPHLPPYPASTFTSTCLLGQPALVVRELISARLKPKSVIDRVNLSNSPHKIASHRADLARLRPLDTARSSQWCMTAGTSRSGFKICQAKKTVCHWPSQCFRQHTIK